jgi:hypothetical protein
MTIDAGAGEDVKRLWTMYDAMTGKRASLAAWVSRESAQRQIEEWKDRQRKGKRPDVDPRRMVVGPVDGLSDAAWEARHG